MNPSLLERKAAYEQFTKTVIRSDYFRELVANNRSYRHVLRFGVHLALFATFVALAKLAFARSPVAGVLVYPIYLYFQGLLVSGFMIHSHELSHNHIKARWLNDAIGTVSGLVSFVNFYSFQYAHRLHHRNIGNLDAPEAGAPVSLTGQKKIRDDDKLAKIMGCILPISGWLWAVTSWPLFLYYGDYSSWILPYRTRDGVNRKSLAVFSAFVVVNLALSLTHPVAYVLLLLAPVLVGGNRILLITYMHHAHEDSVFFNEEHHNFYNVIMSTTDRDYGTVVNFFMMNNGYHIAHHLNPRIAYYDLKNATDYLRRTIPEGLRYNFYPDRHFYREFANNLYERRLTGDHEAYQLDFVPAEALTQRAIGVPSEA